MDRREKLVFPILMAVILQGCIAAVPLVIGALYAFNAFSVYKVVQFSSGGTAEVRFPKENPTISMEDKEELSSLKKLAILPGHRVSTLLAQELSKNKQPEIVTPFQIEKTVGKNSGMVFTPSMTETERAEKIKEIMETMDIASALDYRELSGSSDVRFFSFQSAEMKTTFTVRIISRRTDRVILNLQGEFVMKNPHTPPPQEEIDRVFVSAVMEKLTEVAGWKAQAQQ